MEGSFLRFFVHERDRHQGTLLWQWLLAEANKMQIRGGSAFRAMAGFGRHHHLHTDHFFELAGTLTVEVQFIVTAAEADKLIDLMRRQKVRVLYSRIPASFDVINPDGQDNADPAA